jgi:hypothetical protein
MRRQVGVTLTGLGAFLLVLALMSHFFLPGQLIKFPLDEYSVSRLTGANVSYFSAATGQEVNGASVRAVATTQGDVSAGTSSTAVWNNVTGVFDTTTSSNPGTAISYSTERFAFDRRTGLLVNCCGAEVGTSRPHFSGQGYVWPIGTQKKTYQIFDTTLLRPEPVQYTGTTTVDGMSVYVFVEHIDSQKFGSVTLPGSLVNIDQTTVNLPEYLTATNTYYVDPGTGSPVKVVQDQSETLQNPSTGATALTLYSGTLTSTPQSIQSAVNTASSSDTEISAVQTIGPLVAGLVAIVLLVVGILLIIAEDRDEYEYEDDDEEVGAEA